MLLDIMFIHNKTRKILNNIFFYRKIHNILIIYHPKFQSTKCIDYF